MPLNILADESVDFRIIRRLRAEGFEVVSVLERYGGSPDQQVLQLSREFNSILLTEDRDFGEWIFAHHEKFSGVVYLRYNVEDLNKILLSVIRVFSEQGQNLYGKFSVITVKKIRIRDIGLY